MFHILWKLEPYLLMFVPAADSVPHPALTRVTAFRARSPRPLSLPIHSKDNQ